ncbi:beta-xylosidase [Alteromonas aestuariivivens]|uniref:Beta-xylosidase n=1 Tax=Alteromonas aestuariivivens TaxID=1938339 RepID=A0A3D8MFI2_9ALTE|nr:family 43 glycosylhydrolase [Alteromonas aestuariivivens]RDV29370.1 beta-xylosidase [Alteromonas aestuariivivens]
MSSNQILRFWFALLILSGCAAPQNEASSDRATDTRFHLQAEARKSLIKHDSAVHLAFPNFIRDPYIILGPDNFYYLTGTRLHHITGGAAENYRQEGVEIWRSPNLADWELLGVPYRLGQLPWVEKFNNNLAELGRQHQTPLLWAPELHWLDNRWYITHTTNAQQAVIVASDNIMGPYKETTEPAALGHRHDPSLFRDTDGQSYLLYRACELIKMENQFSTIKGDPIVISPSDRKIGHEGCYLIRHAGKYIMLGTAWSTDSMRKGSYNLYYTTADNIQGPYGKRQWLGRFLGHGTPFKDKNGNWWMTAFLNGKYISHESLTALENQHDNAYTINPQGTTLVPFELSTDPDGNIVFTIKDARYRDPGPEEVQQF